MQATKAPLNGADAMTVAGGQLKEYQEIASEAPLKKNAKIRI